MIRIVTILILALCVGYSGYAQQQPANADTTKQSKVKPNFRPAAIRFGTDLLSLANTQFKEGFSGWEVTADTELHRYLLVVDFGHSAETLGDDSTSYANDGNYWRIGIDANFLTRDPDKNVFFLGMHYGRSRYDEHMRIISDDVFGGGTNDYVNNGMSAGWLELNGGLKVKIWSGLWLGYTARFKFGLSDDKTREMLSHNIPGYGRTNKETAWGFNYYIFYRIPFRTTQSIFPPKK